ncbi:hypothetical protein ES703_48590 [subsurface metagenome]
MEHVCNGNNKKVYTWYNNKWYNNRLNKSRNRLNHINKDRFKLVHDVTILSNVKKVQKSSISKKNFIFE